MPKSGVKLLRKSCTCAKYDHLKIHQGRFITVNTLYHTLPYSLKVIQIFFSSDRIVISAKVGKTNKS